MKLRKLNFLLVGLTMSTLASASTVKFGPASTRKIKDVVLSESVQLTTGDKSETLSWKTAALRQKKVAVFWANVYVAQVFSNEKLDFTSIAALRGAVMKGRPVVLSMTFVRDVDAKKIVEGLAEGFKANEVKSETTPYSKLLEAVQKAGDVKDGQTYFFLFTQDKEKMAFSFQTLGKEQYALTDGDATTTENILRLWLAKTADSGLERMQEQLLKPDSK